MTVLCVLILFFCPTKRSRDQTQPGKKNKTNDKTAILSIAVFHLVLYITADKSIVPAKHTI